MSDVAAFCNNYPNVDCSYELVDADSITAGDAVNVVVTLEREVDEDDEDEDGGAAKTFGQVAASRYPKPKVEGWWLVVGDVSRNALMSIKRLTLAQRARAKLDFVAPDEPGEYDLVLYLMCDSYLGCDQASGNAPCCGLTCLSSRVVRGGEGGTSIAVTSARMPRLHQRMSRLLRRDMR